MLESVPECPFILSSGFFVLSQKGGLSKGQRPPQVEPVSDFSLPPITVILLSSSNTTNTNILTVVLVLVQIVVLLPEAFLPELEACLLLFFLSSSSSSPPSAPRSHLPPLPSLLSFSSFLLFLPTLLFSIFPLQPPHLLSTLLPLHFLLYHFSISPLPVIKKLVHLSSRFHASFSFVILILVPALTDSVVGCSDRTAWKGAISPCESGLDSCQLVVVYPS